MTYLNAPDLEPSDYLILGQATCFARIEGEVQSLLIIEPIPSAAIEALWNKIPTSYTLAIASTLGKIFAPLGDVQLPEGVFDPEAKLCDDFLSRSLAATRTYKAKPASQQLIPLGNIHRDFKFSVDKKRILHLDRVVKEEDNVKQHSHTHRVL